MYKLCTSKETLDSRKSVLDCFGVVEEFESGIGSLLVADLEAWKLFRLLPLHKSCRATSVSKPQLQAVPNILSR